MLLAFVAVFEADASVARMLDLTEIFELVVSII